MVKKIGCMALAIWMALMAYAVAEVMPEDFNAYIAKRFSVRKVISGGVQITQNGKVVYTYTHGHTTKTRKKATTLDTKYRIASTSKMVAAIGLMQLYEQGLFDLDAPLKDVLPYIEYNPYFPDTVITPRQVLSHTSGFAQNNYYTFSWSKIKKGTKYYLKNVAPGTEYNYSNINGGLIGCMIEALSGMSVNQYMRQNVFTPLGIDASYLYHELTDIQNVVPQYNKDGSVGLSINSIRKDGEKYEPVADPENHLGITVGSLIISPEDLSTLTLMLQNGGELNGVRILQEETVRLMQQDQSQIPGSSVLCESKYGLSVARIDDLPGGTWYGHQGMTRGITTDAFYQPDTGLTVVIIANGYSATSVNGLVKIAREIMPLATQYANDNLFAQIPTTVQ